jgi:hypothetical protein
MGILKDFNQKVRGEGKKIEGDIEKHQGQGIKGGMSKIEGNLESKVADAKMRIHNIEKHNKNNK